MLKLTHNAMTAAKQGQCLVWSKEGVYRRIVQVVEGDRGNIEWSLRLNAWSMTRLSHYGALPRNRLTPL
jgi:hypothetical protein